MEVGSLFAGLSALFSGGSVMWAVHTYRRADYKKAVDDLQQTIELAQRRLRDFKSLVSEQATNQMAIGITRHLKETFGSELSPAELADTFRQDTAQPLIIQSLYEGFDQTRSAEDLSRTAAEFSGLVLKLRRISPTLSMLLDKVFDALVEAVALTYSVRYLSKGVNNAGAREKWCAMVEKAPNYSMAVALVGEFFADQVSKTFQSTPGAIIDEEIGMASVILDYLQKLDDRGLKRVRSADAGRAVPVASDSSADRFEVLKALTVAARPLLSNEAQLAVSEHMAKMEGIALAIPRPR